MDNFEKAKDEVMAEVRSLKESLEAEKRALANEKATYSDQNPGMHKTNIEVVSSLRDLKDSLVQKRAFTVNGTGAVGVVSEIVKEMLNKMKLIDKYRYFYGANASTVVPILTPQLAVPAGQSEGATSVASDSTGVLAAKTIQPKAYVSVLPVSAEALLMSGANIEAQLPGIFADAFAKAIFAGSLTGDGTGNNMLGMFVDSAITNDVSCAEAGTPKLLDLANLALTIQDYADDAVIVIAPALVAAMLAETTAESAPIKTEIMTSRSVMGVPLVMSGLAPTTVTAGSVVAVAMPMSNYGVAVANDLIIDPIKVKGDTNTYFQATMFFNGTTIVPKNGQQLVTI